MSKRSQQTARKGALPLQKRKITAATGNDSDSTSTTPPLDVTNARSNAILASFPLAITCNQDQEFSEATDIHAVPVQQKDDFYKETRKRVHQFESIVIDDLNNDEAKRLCSFYKSRFKETGKMYSKSLNNTARLQDDIRNLKEQQDHQVNSAETKDLVAYIKETILKQRNMFTLFATHCFPCNANLPNTNAETLEKYRITSEVGIGEQIFKLINQYYTEVRKAVPSYLETELNRRHLWLNCQIGKQTLANFSAMRNQYRNRIKTEFNKILDDKINNEPNAEMKKIITKMLLLQTFDESMVEIDMSLLTPHEYGDVILELFFQMALYRDDSDKENNQSQRRSAKRRSAKKADERKAKLRVKPIFSSIKPNLLAMILLTLRQRIVVLLKEYADENASVVDILLENMHMNEEGNINKGAYSELISHHQSDGIADCEVKLFYKLRDAIKVQEKIVKSNPDQGAYMFRSDGAHISMDESVEDDLGRSGIVQVQDANILWENSDGDGHSVSSFDGGTYHGGREY